MIDFPGLQLSFAVRSVAFQIFGIEVYFYAICIVLAIGVALLLCYQSKEKFDISFDFIFETLLMAIVVGVIGARIYYVLFNLDKYSANPFRIFQLRDGGLAIYGGLIAGGMVVWRRCKKWNINALDFLDTIVPFIAIAQSIGRWGNFFNVEAYGTETSNLFRMGIGTIDGYKEVHPTFLYESISTFVIFVILRILQKKRKFKGQIVYFYLFFYSGIRGIIEGIRVDSLWFGTFRISQILSGAIFVFSCIMLLKNFGKNINKKFDRSKMLKKVNKKLL